MKKIAVAVCFRFMALTMSAMPALAFNPAAHVYIADHVFPNSSDKINLFYGSVAPDIAQYADTTKWANAFTDTHCNFVDLRPAASGTAQKVFAKGWITHNEKWGADFYAHIYQLGYVTVKADFLSSQFPGLLTGDFAHFAIETAVDLLLKHDHNPALGTKLLEANLLRSWLDRELLVKALVVKNHETDWITLTSAELAFRNILNQYATALALPKPLDKEAIIVLGVQLAKQQYGIDTTADQLRHVLDAAIFLCQGDYYSGAILPAIQGILAQIQ